ncbi:MAG: hypothetical protein RL701_3775, partial [Pseudomonadota bacterium]
MPSVLRFVRRPWPWIILAGSIALYAAVGFWWLPRLLASGIRDAVATRYHRTAQVGPVTFNPFTFELDARKVSIPDADQGPLLSFDRLYVNVALSSLWRRGLEFQAITLEGPRVRAVRRADGRLNLQDLVLPSEPKQKAENPRLWIETLVVRGGQLLISDLDRPKPLTLTLEPVVFTVHKFSTASEGNAYSLELHSPRGEGFSWQGTFGIAPLASRGTFLLERIEAQTLAEIGAEQIPCDVSSGTLDVSGSYEFAEQGTDFALRAQIANLTLAALGLRTRGDQTDTIQIPRIAVTNTAFDLNAHTLTVAQVSVEGPHIQLVRDRAGRLNLARWQPTAPTAPTAPKSGAKPWTVAVNDLRVSSGVVGVEDRGPTQPARFQLAPLNLTVGGLAFPSRGPLALHVDTGVNDTGHFDATGELTPAELTGHFAIAATGLPLPALQPYLDDTTGLIVRTGKARIKGDLTLRANASLGFEGNAGVDELATVDRELEEDLVHWRSLDLYGLRAYNVPMSLALDEIIAKEPYARLIVGKNGGTNIRDLLTARTAKQEPQPTAATAPAAPPNQASLPIEIGLVRVDDGSLNFADLSIKPHFETGIRHLAGTIKGLSEAPDARADVALAGEVDRYTPVKITGKVNYFAAVTHTKLHLNFKNMELTSLSPYSGKFAGYAIERGKLNVDLNYVIEKRRLDAKHKIVINQLQLGAAVKSPDATSLPVKLAVALLKDRNGVIDLELPVSGNLDDPKFRVWPLIWQVLGNLLVKAVTSPFALLGSLFGGGEELSYIDFAPGVSTLDATAKSKIHTLAKALDARPGLNLDVPLIAQPELDRKALAKLAWQADVEKRATRRLGKQPHDRAAVAKLLNTPKAYRALLEDAYRERFGTAPVVPHVTPPATDGRKPPKKPQQASDGEAIPWLERALKARVVVEQSELDLLAQARAESVQKLLLDGTAIDPARV